MYQEKQNTKEDIKGISISIGVHLLLLLLFIWLVVWRMPDPMPPGMPGVEINLGFESTGDGEIQTNTAEEQVQPQEEVVEEEVVEEAIVNEEKVVTTTNPSEVVVKEEVKQKKVEPKEEVVESQNLFNKPNSKSDGNTDKKGDQGDEQGNPDSRNLFKKGDGNGTSGGNSGIGSSLDMPGWMWDKKPDKVDPTSENGYVVFEFFVDEDGNVINIKKIGGANFTPSEDNFYKQQLLQTTFSLRDPRQKAPTRTRGVYTFKVKSK